MADQLSALYSEFLEGGYDCVNRVVLDAYFCMGQSGGGFRTWSRERYGSDEDLDDNRWMRMAERFSRRFRAWAKANGVPVIYCSCTTPGSTAGGCAKWPKRHSIVDLSHLAGWVHGFGSGAKGP